MKLRSKLSKVVLGIGLAIVSPAVLFGPAHNVHAAEATTTAAYNIPANAVPVEGNPSLLKIEEGNVTTFIDAKTGEFMGKISAKPRG
ncbi:hypothetical protein TP70_05885 [Staphylococcus microti]|uniref:Uncharacterized protein n=1 Tax=Staphylococcus microti TaxID=569857 RepID=A0A0D6XRC5_9STAP|nr:hypothetical protein [Staphylococcus microti]KIX90806.1 hypothetical protein TP70_05885 [Staphylococcus microti]PNZ82198.1 hypothetical protein CD132_04860 [Staphylococcus microti]SUM57466.1 Uncharacterised protein [Staphylococcus microti]